MNPDKLFDYLDGKLSPNERAELEERLMSDPEARRELAVARQIHASMGDSREVDGIADPALISERGPVLARRIMIAFIVLVFANVGFGIYAIFFMKNKQRAREADRTKSDRAHAESFPTAAAALPTPTLKSKRSHSMRRSGREIVGRQDHWWCRAIRRVGTKGLSNEHGVLIFAEIANAAAE